MRACGWSPWSAVRIEIRSLISPTLVWSMNWRGRFTASSCRAVEGDHHGAPADLVVLCAFSLFNVQLMLLSGIGKPYDPVADVGAVGRNYSYQNLNLVTLFFDDSVQANGFIGIGGGGTTFDDLNGNQLDSAKAGFVGGGVIWARQPGSGPIRGIATAPGVPNWGSAWKQGVKDAFRHSFYYEVQDACMSYRSNYLDLDPTYRDAF